MNKPAISVAMSVFNNAPYLEASIVSILEQSFGDFEFLVVNDGSSDESASIIEGFARLDGRIRLFCQPNRGLVTSLNRLLAEAGAPLIARMDGDDIALPERFARQVEYLRSHPDVGVLGTSTHDIDESGKIVRENAGYPCDHDALVEGIGHRSPFCHPSVIMRTDVVRGAGGYRAAFAHCEDYDLWLRLAERTLLANLPEPLLLYRRSAGQVSNRHVLTQHFGSEVARLARRERQAGRPDPIDGLGRIPSFEELDLLFGTGAGHQTRANVALSIVHSPVSLRGEGLNLIVEHVDDGGRTNGLWRTACRLMKLGEVRRAVLLALALIRARFVRRQTVPRRGAPHLRESHLQPLTLGPIGVLDQ